MIYFDNAATSLPKPPEVIEAVVKAMNVLGNAGRGANEASLDASRNIYLTRSRLAELFHAESPERIAFTSNSTESLNIAIKGLLEPGDHVITTALEHNSVLRPLYEMEARGVSLTIVPADSRGDVDYGEMEGSIRPDTRAIVCTHGSNFTGNLVDIGRVGEIARRHGILLIVDASQTAGVFPIDVQEMGIDVLCFTGHKSLRGPQGTGGIYVRTGLEIRPLKSGGSGIETFSRKHPSTMPTALEAGTLNGHGIAGLGAALEYLKETGMDQIRRIEQINAGYFYKEVSQLPGVHVYGNFECKERCPIVTLNIGDMDSAEVGDILYDEYGIAVRTGAHCAPLMHEHFGTVEQGAVRFSFSHYNTKAEIDVAIEAIRALAEDIK